MDSERMELLERARELGSLAHTLSWDEILNRSVTYRTLALNLGIQKEWWEEFWRSFSFSREAKTENLQGFRFCCKAKDLSLLMRFLSSWFGKNERIAGASKKEFLLAYHIFMRD